MPQYIKGGASRQSGSVHVPVRYETWKIPYEWPKQFDVRQILSPKYYIKNVTSFKNHKYNPFHSSLSLSIRSSLFIPSLNALSGDFYVSFNLVAVLTLEILSKCCDKAHLTFNLHFWFSKLWCSQLCKKETFCATKVNWVTHFQCWRKWVKY